MTQQQPSFDPDHERRVYYEALTQMRDQWVAAGCGSEVPCLVQGRWVLYVFNPGTGQHGWLDYATDTVTVDR